MKSIRYVFIVITITLIITTLFPRTSILALGDGFNYGNVPSSDDDTALNTVKEPINKVWNTFIRIVQIASFAGIFFAGLRYMFSSVDQKAEIKKSLASLVIGIAIVFSFTTIIDLIVKIFREATG